MEGKLIGTNRYALEQTVRCYDVDSAMRLRPSSFMDYAQELAYLAADAMHFGYDELMREGKAWVLSRMHIVFDDIPHWRDKIELTTWHKGPAGPFYIRDFSLCEDNKVRVRATSSWVILDIRERRMVRSSEVVEMIPESTVCHDNAIEEPAARIMAPKGFEMQLAGSHTVQYSDIDLQGHTNNARYVLWAVDCIGTDVLKEHPVRELTVNFNHETLAGEVVELFICHDGTDYFVEGHSGGHIVFCVKVKLYD